MSLEKKQEQETTLNYKESYIKEAVLLESKLKHLFVDISSNFVGKIISFQLMRDDDFVHRRDRIENDIHMFFELKNGEYFHLRGYTRFMLTALELVKEGKIFLTGYRKNTITHNGGEHSFKQKWYENDANKIADEIISQNLDIFNN